MKRLFSLPAIGLLFTFLTASLLAKAQYHFTVEVKGTGTPMILIHGLYCSGDVWKETVEHYQKNYECHILTLAGFGGNAPSLSENYLQTIKDDVVSYVKNKKLTKPVIMGHSMGGFLAFWTASSAPGLFGKVIAVDGIPYVAVIQMPGATPETAKPMAENIRNGMASATPEQTLASQKAYLPSMITDPDRVNYVANIASHSDAKTQGQVIYEMMTTDLRQAVQAIDCPVLLLGSWIGYKNYGATHESTLAAYSAQVAAIKNCKVEITDTARHFIFYDDPAWFFEKVDTFLGYAQ